MANRSGAVLTLNHDSRFVRNGSVTQARALKVSDLTGATGNRYGSNRYLKKVGGPGGQIAGEGHRALACLAVAAAYGVASTVSCFPRCCTASYPAAVLTLLRECHLDE